MNVKKTFVRDGAPLDVSVSIEAGQRVGARVGDRGYELEFEPGSDGGLRLIADGVAREVFVAARGPRLQVRIDGATFELEAARGRGAAAATGSGAVEAPMTGTVLDVLVAVGDEVSADRQVVVLGAMKMEHKLTAGVAGTVREVTCRAGDLVDQGRLLVRVEAAPKP